MVELDTHGRRWDLAAGIGLVCLVIVLFFASMGTTLVALGVAEAFTRAPEVRASVAPPSNDAVQLSQIGVPTDLAAADGP